MPQDLPTLALSILNVSRNTLSIHLRFMNLAISRLRWLSIPDAVREMPMLQRCWTKLSSRRRGQTSSTTRWHSASCMPRTRTTACAPTCT